MPHFTLDLRAGVPGGRRGPVPGRLRGGGDPEPVRAAATATCGWTRCSSSPTRLGRADAGHRPLRAGHRRRAAARRRRPGQGPDLHARGAVAGVAGAHALPAGRADQARGARARRRGRAAGRLARRLAGPVLPRRHRQGALPRPPRGPRGRAGRDRDSSAGEVVGAHRGSHHFTVGQRKGLGVAARRAAVRAAHRGAANRVVVGSRDELGHRPRRACAAPACTARAPRSTPSACATTRAPCPAAWRARRRGRASRLELELGEPFHGAAPGQAACLLRGDVIVGWATITI